MAWEAFYGVKKVSAIIRNPTFQDFLEVTTREDFLPVTTREAG
ncbi:hypothetical protein [Ketobacter sp.]